MTKILVTGGSGMVGRHLREILPDAEYISSKDYDLTNEADVRSLCERGWDHVIHLAARVGGILENISRPGDFIEENLLINALLLKYARAAKIPRLTAILSTCIYPDVYDRYPMVEEDIHNGPPQRTNFSYAIAKRAVAVHIDAINQQYGTQYNYLIPCNLYGEFDSIDETKSHFVTALLAKILKAEREGANGIQLLGTGRPMRQFMYAGDLAEVINDCVEKQVTESFNVAVSENLTIKEIAETALKATGNEHLAIRFDNEAKDGQFRKDVSNEKMLRVLPGFEFTPLAKGIRKVYEYYKSNNIV